MLYERMIYIGSRYRNQYSDAISRQRVVRYRNPREERREQREQAYMLVPGI